MRKIFSKTADLNTIQTNVDDEFRRVTEDLKALISARETTALPATIVIGGAGVVGSAITFSPSDHVHPFPSFGTTAGTICEGNDSRLSDSRTPTAHATSHQSGGSDAIKLDDLAAPDDNTDLNASTSSHGLLRKLSNSANDVLTGDGNWTSTHTAPDSSTLLYWKLDETSGATTWVNSGSLGSSGNCTISSGTIESGRVGRFDRAVNFVSGFIRENTGGTTTNPTSTTALSLHGWVKLYTSQAVGYYGRLISKWYNTSHSGAAPDSIALAVNASSTQVFAQCYNAGVNKATSFITKTPLVLGTWHHVALTYNAGTVKIYIDGNLELTDSTWPTSLSWNGSSGGYWSLGGAFSSAQTCLNSADLDDWRVDDGIVRSATYFYDLYRKSNRWY